MYKILAGNLRAISPSMVEAPRVASIACLTVCHRRRLGLRAIPLTICDYDREVNYHDCIHADRSIDREICKA